MSHRNIGSSGGAGVEPDLKRRRLLDAGGPVEDDETARRKMRKAKVYYKEEDVVFGEFTGFDPESVCQTAVFEEDYGPVSPMGYFAELGDLPMMRWLYVNGADTRDPEVELCFPMYMAASGGHLEVCKWLYDHGAAQDIKRRIPLWIAPIDLSPLGAISRKSHIKRYSLLGKWLILKGALCKDDDSGDLDLELIERDLTLRPLVVPSRGNPDLVRGATMAALVKAPRPAQPGQRSWCGQGSPLVFAGRKCESGAICIG